MTTIAWIEDDYDEIASLVRLLELDGYTILRYRSRPDVDSRIDEVCKCDAIILDIILPPVNDDPHQGISILKKLRKEYRYEKPVVVCSVVRAPGAMDALRKLDIADEYILHKPVRPSVLYATVKKALGI